MLTVRVLDAIGHPVSGIRLHSTALQTAQQDVAWDTRLHGMPRDDVTAADGSVQVEYPAALPEGQLVTAVSCVVRHPAWVASHHRIRVDDNEPKVRLERGRRLAVNAVHQTTQKPITEHVHAVLSGSTLRDTWKQYADGLLVSPTVSFNRTRLRMIWIPDDGPTQFSRLIRISESEKSPRMRFRDVSVAPGTRVKGKLSDDVPRPVTNGYICAVASHHAGIGDRDRRMTWEEWAPIDSDGSFELPSLPADGFVQLIARCDGWVSDMPTSQDLEKAGLAQFRGTIGESRYLMPHVFRLGMVERICEIRMQRTVDCVVQAVSHSGMPLEGVKVSVFPRHQSFSGTVRPLGSGSSHSRYYRLPPEQRQPPLSLDAQRRMLDLGILLNWRDPFEQTTDAEGRAVISQLPPGTAEKPARIQVNFRHELFGPAGEGTHVSKYTDLIEGQTAELIMDMGPVDAEPAE